MSWGIGDRVGVAVSAGTIATFNSRRPGPVPSLVLDFAGTGTLDPRVTFTRSTTGTYYNSSGVLTTAAINEARFDYNPSTLAPLGLLIEQSSTNTVLYSEDYTNIYWTKNNTTITPNATTAPNGTTTASLFTAPFASTPLSSLTNNGAIAAGTYTMSVYYKNDAASFLNLFCSDAVSNYSAAWVNLSTNTVAVANGGTFSGASATVTASAYGFNRVTLTFTKPVTAQSSVVIGNLVASSGSFTKLAGSIYLWGAQIEALAFPTSYIPTTSAQVTRAADTPPLPIDTWYNTSQGTWFAQVNMLSTAGTPRIVGATPSSKAPILISSQAAAMFDSTTTIASANTITANTTQKIATAWDGTTGLVCLNGGTVATGSQSTGYADLSTIGIGYNSTSSNNFINGRIAKITYYPTALTNAQLQALTT